MKKRIIARLGMLLASLLASATLATTAQAASQFDVGSLPFQVSPNECIGGGKCGGPGNTIDFFIHNGLVVASIAVVANDNFGDSTNARLQLLADGVVIGDQDVKAAGSTLFYPVGRPASKLSLRSVQDDETIVQGVTLRR